MIIIAMISLASCNKMDDTYADIIKNGPIIYTGKADSSKYFAGNQRIKLQFLISDPKVSEATIYWNSKRDSVIIPITKTAKIDTISTLLTNAENGITEGSYVFEIYTYDIARNRSVKVELPAKAYGSFFQSTLLSRPIQKVARSGTNVTIDWFGAEEGSSGVEVVYTQVSGELKTVFVPTKDTQTILPSYKAGTKFKHRTVFLPEPLAIDTFYTEYIEVQVN
jgi:hypothetical protein